MKDYGRKHYTDYQYRDWMRAIPAKSIWNPILERHPGQAEFSGRRLTKTSLEKAIADYIKQSERKKPYLDRGFVQMEDDWEGPPGGFSPPSLPNFDQPWNTSPPGSTLTPWTVIFDLISSSCWCKDDTRDFEISGTHPIYGLGISLQEPGTGIIIDGGLGTNTVFGRITGGPDEVGDVNFTGFMTTSTGISGNSNYLMPECRDCDLCPGIDPLVAGSNPETISQSGSETILVVDGLGPFNWSVSGSGFTLDEAVTELRSNTLNAAVDACGTATITVTDACDDEVEIQVRCIQDSDWVLKSSTCVMPGASTEGDGKTIIIGGSKQVQTWKPSGGGSCGTTIHHPCEAGDTFCISTIEVCVDFNCDELTGISGSTQIEDTCCNSPCSPPIGGTICSFWSGTPNDVLYYEWECI